MQIDFNKERMHVQIICGILEEYQPTKEVKEIEKLVADLKEKLVKFQKEVVVPEVQKIQDMVTEFNEQQQKKFEKKEEPKK